MPERGPGEGDSGEQREPAPEGRPLLITGFEPFGGASHNPSSAVLPLLLERNPRLAGRLRVGTIPVVYEAAVPALVGLVARHAPRAVICLGVHGGPPQDEATVPQAADGTATATRRGLQSFYVEALAVNQDDAPIADNAGELRRGLAIDPELPAEHSLESTLSTDHLVSALRDGGWDVSLSRDAGRYLCNHLFYGGLRVMGEAVPIGFVHVPPSEETRPGALTLDQIAQAVAALARRTLRLLDDGGTRRLRRR